MAVNDKIADKYSVPASTARQPFVTRIEVRRSIFLSQTARCEDARSAREFVALRKAENSGATHNCWAFVAGPPGNSASIGFSDDGEPRGTAGKPILNVLMHCGVGQIATVVSRWFGGIKLGKGGLARAYQDAALENVKNLPLEVTEPRMRFMAAFDYTFLDSFKRLLLSANAVVEKEEYGNNLEILFNIPVDNIPETRARLEEISSGRIKLEELP